MKERLNSNIFKNIFAEPVYDLGRIEELEKNCIRSNKEVKQLNHGFHIGDVLSLRDGHYALAVADDVHRTERICGIVTFVRSESIFTLMDSGRLPYEHLDFKDTTILYLSDKNPGKMCHYKEIDNMTYIPIAIYTEDSIIINILDGASGTFLHPYDERIDDDTQNYENYTQAELDSAIATIWSII